MYKLHEFRKKLIRVESERLVESAERICFYRAGASNSSLDFDIRYQSAMAYKSEVAYFESIGGAMPTCKN